MPWRDPDEGAPWFEASVADLGTRMAAGELSCRELTDAYLRRIDDEMDAEGFVHLRDEPGLGQDIDLDYITAHTV